MGRVLHFGEYDGCDIDELVETDPAYIVWAYCTVTGRGGISQKAYQRARSNLDRYEQEEEEPLDDRILENYFNSRGYSIEDDF